MSTSDVIEELFKLDTEPLKLYDYQKEWVDDEGQFRIVNKSRQTGFSFVCAAEALVKAMFVPRSVILFVSTGERGAIRLMKYVHNLWRSVPQSIKDQFPLETDSKREFAFKHNDSQIISLPNNADNVRGYPATDLYIDEFAFFDNEDDMWKAIIPSITRSDLRRRVSLISTPNGKLNTYYKIYEEIKDTPEDVWSRHLVPHTECPDINIKELKKTLTPTAFRQEYECEFIDSVTSVIPFELIDKCIDRDLVNCEKVDHTHLIYVGIDFGKKRDSTVATYFEKIEHGEDEEPVFIMKRMDVFTDMDYSLQMELIKDRLKLMKANQVWVDQTGVGERLYEELRKENVTVNGIVFTRAWKERAVTDMVLMMQKGKVKFLDDDRLIKQLHDLRRKVTINGNVRFEHDKNKHDDIFWSIALALSQASHQKGFFGLTGSSGWNI